MPLTKPGYSCCWSSQRRPGRADLAEHAGAAASDGSQGQRWSTASALNGLLESVTGPS